MNPNNNRFIDWFDDELARFIASTEIVIQLNPCCNECNANFKLDYAVAKQEQESRKITDTWNINDLTTALNFREKKL